MNQYTVKVPVVGYTYVTVDAQDEDEAILQAILEADDSAPDQLAPVHYVVLKGVCYAPCVEAHVVSTDHTDTTLDGETVTEDGVKGDSRFSSTGESDGGPYDSYPPPSGPDFD